MKTWIFLTDLFSKLVQNSSRCKSGFEKVTMRSRGTTAWEARSPWTTSKKTCCVAKRHHSLCRSARGLFGGGRRRHKWRIEAKPQKDLMWNQPDLHVLHFRLCWAAFSRLQHKKARNGKKKKMKVKVKNQPTVQHNQTTRMMFVTAFDSLKKSSAGQQEDSI